MAACGLSPEWLAAIKLNNAAIALLDRGHYVAARHASTDAIIVMKSFFKQRKYQTKSTVLPTHARACTTRKLVRATKLLAKSSRRHCQRHPISLVVLQDEDSPSTLQSIISHTTATSLNDKRVCSVIRIEPVDGDRNEDLDSAIMMHNYSVVYRFLALSAESERIRVNLLDGVFQLSSLAYSSFSHYSKQELRDNRMSRVLVGALVVLQNMLPVAADLGMDDCVSFYTETLYHLRSIARELQSHQGSSVTDSAAAA